MDAGMRLFRRPDVFHFQRRKELLRKNELTDISFAEKLPALEQMDLTDNFVTDLKPLSAFQRRKELLRNKSLHLTCLSPQMPRCHQSSMPASTPSSALPLWTHPASKCKIDLYLCSSPKHIIRRLVHIIIQPVRIQVIAVGAPLEPGSQGRIILRIIIDDYFLIPHSRHTEVPAEAIHGCRELTVLAESEEAGVLLCMTGEGSVSTTP